MMRSLSTAASGMQAQEQKLEQIANDMANMNTTAFKRGRTEFQDLMYQQVKDAGGQPGAGQTPVGVQVGTGTHVSAQYSVHEQGPSKITRGTFDLMINGEGFFAVQLPNGQVGYTRDGSFKMDSTGKVVNSVGYPMIPNLQIPAGAAGVTISENGEVRILTATGQEQQVGQVQLVNFLNPQAMRNFGHNIVSPTTASGPPVQGNPNDGGMGSLVQGSLEGSNVNPTESVMDMIATQRTYESNARIMSVGDQMWSTTNNIGNR